MNAKESAVRIVTALRERGRQAYLVGGCVRDLLLGREPVDFDVATDATPEQAIEIFPEAYAIGAQFGVVLVPAGGKGNGHVEVATFRSDIGNTDGRHPDEVRCRKNPKEDVRGRDSTTSALFLAPITNKL